jgi:hypothetical protein
VFSGAPQINVGTYPVLVTLNDPLYQGSATGTFFITPAASTTTVTCPASVTYNGGAQTPCVASVTGTGGLSKPLVVSYSNNINAGTATATASYSDGNHTGSSDSKTFSIAKAPVTATAGSGSSTYDGLAHAPSSACVVTGSYTGDLSCTNSPSVAGPAAGSTTITPNVTGTGLTNFAITPINGSYVIGPAASSTVCPSSR